MNKGPITRTLWQKADGMAVGEVFTTPIYSHAVIMAARLKRNGHASRIRKHLSDGTYSIIKNEKVKII